MRYVLDASTALAWEIPRPHSVKALRLRRDYRQRVHELIAPDLFMDEVAGALTKAERQKLIALGAAAPLYAKIMNDSPVLLPHVSLIPRALDISSQTRSAYYDCLYVALAERENCELVTDDDRLVHNLQTQFPFVIHLASLP
jgi:predicted nucleic acid-binding protein